MAQPEQEPLFSETPDREYDKGSTETWKDKALAEDLAKLHNPGDPFNRRDDQGRETMGQIRHETSGLSRRQAERKLITESARRIVNDTYRQTTERRQTDRTKLEQKQSDDIIDLLRDTRPS